jgi:hypothetical protein
VHHNEDSFRNILRDSALIRLGAHEILTPDVLAYEFTRAWAVFIVYLVIMQSVTVASL